MTKYWMLIGILLSVSGCTSLSPKTFQDDARILVVTQTSNEYQLAHMSFHLFPSFRDIESTVIDPGWNMTALFNDLILENTQNSRFNYVVLKEPIDPPDDEVDLSNLVAAAQSNDADYVLLLRTDVRKNNISVNTNGGHYGYVHESVKGFDNIGRIFANIEVKFYKADTLESALVHSKTCGRRQEELFYERIKPALTLPAHLDNVELKALLNENELEVVIDATKALATAEILAALKSCRLE